MSGRVVAAAAVAVAVNVGMLYTNRAGAMALTVLGTDSVAWDAIRPADYAVGPEMNYGLFVATGSGMGEGDRRGIVVGCACKFACVCKFLIVSSQFSIL